MKKIIVLIVLLFALSGVARSQGHPNIDTTKLKLTTLYNTMYGTSITAMGDIYQYYEVAVQCPKDTTFTVYFNSTWTRYIHTRAGWNYLGRFKAGEQTDLWLQKQFPETTAVELDVLIWGVK